MNFGMYPNPELSLKFHISKQSMFRITSITEKHMKVKTLLSFAAALCCAAAFSMSAQAQLKNSPMHANLPDNATTKDCLVCHQSYQAVAQKTAKMNPNLTATTAVNKTAPTAIALRANRTSNAMTAIHSQSR